MFDWFRMSSWLVGSRVGNSILAFRCRCRNRIALRFSSLDDGRRDDVMLLFIHEFPLRLCRLILFLIFSLHPVFSSHPLQTCVALLFFIFPRFRFVQSRNVGCFGRLGRRRRFIVVVLVGVCTEFASHRSGRRRMPRPFLLRTRLRIKVQ